MDLAESVRCARAGAAVAPSGFSEVVQDAGAVFKIDQRGNTKGLRKNSEKCTSCGYKNHKSSECRFSNYTCKLCNRKGHLRKMCSSNKVNYVEQGNADDEEDDDDGELLLNINCANEVPLAETVSLEGQSIKCEIDSGSPVSVISESLYKSKFSEVPLSTPTKSLLTYTSTKMVVIGCMALSITYLGHTNKLTVYVIRDGGPPLLGRDFMRAFNLRLVSTFGYCNNMTDADSVMQSLTNAYPKVFSEELGCFNKFEIQLPLKPDAKPVFFKSRPVPFAIRDKVNNELDRLVTLGILKPVSYSEYASPIVPVLKRDGSIRICADYSVTINKQLLVEKYPLPTAQVLFTKLHGGEEFSKLDLSMAYNQLKIHENSQNITCINTPRGLLNYSRLIFGLASAASIFQRVIESIVGNMEGVLVFQDDVCITGINRIEHMKRLKEVLRRLQEAGLTLRKDKCVFFQSEISYLGYIIDKNGIRKNPVKVNAIMQAAAPKNVSELQSFLGLINYYRNFTPNAFSILSPLHELLKKIPSGTGAVSKATLLTK